MIRDIVMDATRTRPAGGALFAVNMLVATAGGSTFTFAELADTRTPTPTDGISLVPALMGRPAAQRAHAHLYWEFAGHQAVRMGDWKAVRLKGSPATELYDLAADPSERTNVAAGHRDFVARAEETFRTGRSESALFPLVRTT